MIAVFSKKDLIEECGPISPDNLRKDQLEYYNRAHEAYWDDGIEVDNRRKLYSEMEKMK